MPIYVSQRNGFPDKNPIKIITLIEKYQFSFTIIFDTLYESTYIKYNYDFSTYACVRKSVASFWNGFFVGRSVSNVFIFVCTPLQWRPKIVVYTHQFAHTATFIHYSHLTWNKFCRDTHCGTFQMATCTLGLQKVLYSSKFYALFIHKRSLPIQSNCKNLR